MTIESGRGIGVAAPDALTEALEGPNKDAVNGTRDGAPGAPAPPVPLLMLRGRDAQRRAVWEKYREEEEERGGGTIGRRRRKFC